ncbi:MAG TPA: hypothetical protein VGM44_14985, partial [Polyangiaceae bacterium]
MRRARVAERVALGAALSGALLLLATPNTEAQSAPDATLVPWPLGTNADDVAMSGGLVLLRQRGSQMIRVPKSEFFMGSS